MKRIFLIVAVVLSALVLHAQQPVSAPVDSTLMAKLVFESTTHDYGTINQGADGNCVFKFKNEGKTPLVLSSVNASCGCTTPSYTKEPVLPGQSGEIKVHYDTNRIGAFSKSITVNSNAKNTPVVLKIMGTVLQPPTPATADTPVTK
jgi:hypothetical protein